MYQTTSSQRNSHTKSTASIPTTVQPGTLTRKWEDIISSHSTVPHQGLKPQDTVTFRGGPIGRKLTNKELLAKADLILARSPNKNMPAISHSRPPIHIDSFKSPTKANAPVPPSYPSTVARETITLQTQDSCNPFVSPQSERMAHTLAINFHSPPPGYLIRQETAPELHAHVPSHFSSPGYDRERLDNVVGNILRRSPGLMTSPLRTEPFVHTIPSGRAPIQVIHQHPEHVVTAAVPHYRVVHNVPQHIVAQPGLPELAEIQRDFQQLRINSLRQPIETNLMTPTPFVVEHCGHFRGPSAFGPELLVDEIDDSGIDSSQPELEESGMQLQSDRDSCCCSSQTSYIEPVQERQRARNNNRYRNPVLDEPREVFRTEVQSGGNGVGRNPYGRPPIDNVTKNNRRYHNPVLDEPREVFRTGVQSGGNVAGRNPNKITSSNNQQNYQPEEVSYEDSRVLQPQRFVEEVVQGRSQKPKNSSASTSYMPRTSPTVEEEPIRRSTDLQTPSTSKDSARRGFGIQTTTIEDPARSSRLQNSGVYEKERSDVFSRKSEGFPSPQKTEVNKDIQKRDPKYANKVESGVKEAPKKKKLPNVLSKTEKFFV